MPRAKGCVPWNKGIDQRTGERLNCKVKSVQAKRKAWQSWRREIREAVYFGILKRSPTCDKCGKASLTHAFPRVGQGIYDVDWFCAQCQPKSPTSR